MRLIHIIFLLSISCTLLQGQISFSQFPKNNQLYPRDLETNKARVLIAGVVGISTADSLIVRVETSDGQYASTAYFVPDFPNDSFEISFEIEASLRNYQFKVELKNSDSTWLEATAANVVAGDVIMVQGQSNAQAVAYNGNANIWQSNYVRCFGNSDPANYTDQQWYVAEGNGYFAPGAIGQWPLRMASLLQENFQVPIAVINGADPGKPIEFFQRNDAFPTDPESNYGRLLQRLNNAALADKVRAIIFYQGESDGDRAAIHKTLFEALYADWAADFPQVEAYFAVQVREGCGAPSLQLRQYQKEFDDYLPRFTSVTANGILGHDGCHYNVLGYGQLGEKMYQQLASELFDAVNIPQLNVRVISAQYLNDTNTTIAIETDADSLIAQVGSHTDFKLLGVSSSITGIQVEGSRIMLFLDEPVFEANIRLSYAGHSGDVNGWVLNGAGFGLFTFYDLPIDNHTAFPNYDIPGIMSGPGNCLNLDGADDCIYIGPVLNGSYTKEAWINWRGGGLGNNIISGAGATAFWLPDYGNGFYLSAGHNGAWTTIADPTPMVPNQWTHVALTYDGNLGEFRLYKNGNLVNTALNVLPYNDPELYIGSFAGGYTFKGRMDEVRVWDAPRSQEAIRANMCRKLKGDEAGLISYFRFDQQEGLVVGNVTDQANGQLLGSSSPDWQRSAAPIGTSSAFAYQDTSLLSLALASGDSLVLSNMNVPEFVHLYFTEEVPNVLQAPEGHTLVDNARYFGLFYPEGTIDSFDLSYFYKGNPFTMVDEPRLSLLQRRNNAQPFWELEAQAQFDFTDNTVLTKGKKHQEYILSIQENTIGTAQQPRGSGRLFPNPSSGQLFVKNLELERVNIFDIHGQQCLEQNGPIWYLELEPLPNGVYLVVMQDTSGSVYQERIVLMK